MYKRITLEKFERKAICKIPDYQFESIEEEFERVINVLNNGIEDGYDFSGSFLSSYKDKLYGMRTICCMVGIDFEIKFEKADEIEMKGDEVGTNVIN